MTKCSKDDKVNKLLLCAQGLAVSNQLGQERQTVGTGIKGFPFGTQAARKPRFSRYLPVRVQTWGKIFCVRRLNVDLWLFGVNIIELEEDTPVIE